MSVYLDEGISPLAVKTFFKNCSDNSMNIRALQIIKKGEPLVRVSVPPYDFEEECYLYSLSKSFTSIACGICMDDGKLSVDTKICELFKDKMPETVSPYLEKLTLGDLLSMQSGHGECALPYMRTSDDSLRAFFEVPFIVEPGKVFCYDTGATCICGAAVERVTGKKLAEFLYERMLSHMDIKMPRWDECMDGQTFGGTGLYLSNNDIVKFGTMLINKGVYNGTRIISEKYLAEATQKQSLEPDDSIKKWTSGYGYQFWMNGRGGYRGDGAFGQFCFVFPEEDIIVVFTGESMNTTGEMDFMYEMLDNLYGNGGDVESLSNLIENIYKPAPVEGGFNDYVEFSVEENDSDIRKIRFFGENLLHVEMETDYGKKEIVCGNGEYILNRVMLKNLSVGLDARDERRDIIERLSLYCAYEIIDEKHLKLTLRHKDKPHTQYWHIDLKEGKIDIKIMAGTITTTFLKLSPLERAE